MGFFSWDCKGCNHSIRSRDSVVDESEWMMQVVVLKRNGGKLVGEYDGYGRVRDGFDEDDIGYDNKAALYHRACYAILGAPGFDGPSDAASDQGYFVGEYDPPEPFTMDDLAALRKVKQEEWSKRQREYEEWRAKNPTPDYSSTVIEEKPDSLIFGEND